MASTGKNYAYNLALTLCNYIFPLITFPYVSRVLGVASIGVCNFVDGIINWAVIVAALGVGSYGVREIARCASDKDRLTKVFSNLVAINLIGTLLAITALVVCSFTVPKLAEYKPFLLFGTLKLAFSAFLVEWFYQGMQEFRYITLRSVAVRAFYVVCVFIFVRNAGDTLVFYILTVVTIAANACINWIYSRRFVRMSFRTLELKVFLFPVLAFGYYRIMTSMYTTFNTVYLGFVGGDIQVGYFATALKLYSILLSAFTALTTVLVPKISALLSEGRRAEAKEIADKSLMLLFSVGVPVVVFALFFSKELIGLLAGAGYEGAIVPFDIVIFLILVIGLEQIVIQQFIMASRGSEKYIFILSSLGAAVGLGLNFALTPRLGAVGSAIAWGSSELAVLVSGVVIMKKLLGFCPDWKIALKELAAAVIYAAAALLPFLFIHGTIARLAVAAVALVAVFLIFNFVFVKNQIFIDTLQLFLAKFSHGKDGVKE